MRLRSYRIMICCVCLCSTGLLNAHLGRFVRPSERASAIVFQRRDYFGVLINKVCVCVVQLMCDRLWVFDMFDR